MCEKTRFRGYCGHIAAIRIDARCPWADIDPLKCEKDGEEQLWYKYKQLRRVVVMWDLCAMCQAKKDTPTETTTEACAVVEET